MKKIIIILTLCLAFLAAKATYPQTLPIDQTSFFAPTAINADGVNLEKGVYADATQTATAPLMANQWNRSGKLTSGEGGGVSPLIENSTLSYSTYVDNNAGKSIILDANIQPSTVASSTFRSTIYSLTSSSSDYFGTFYLSALVNFSGVTTTTGVDFLTFDGNYAGNTQRGRVFMKASGTTGKYLLGVGFDGVVTGGTVTAGVNTWSGDLAFGTTYLIVLKFTTAATAGNEIASLFINPTPGETEAATTSLNNTVSGIAGMKSIKGITIRQRPGIGGKLAGFRLSDNWADVVKASTSTVPQLSIPVIGNATGINDTGFTANWTPVTNATGYDIKVFQGTALFTTKNVTGQATATAVVTGLTAGSTYTYKVTAKGNGTTYGDSDLSASSAAFSTTGVSSVDFIRTNFGDGTWGTIASTTYATGAYPSSTLNGFNLVKAYLYAGSLTCPTGESHTNRIMVGRGLENASIEFPTLKTVGEVEIHAVTGTEGMSFRLEEWVNNAWSVLGTYMTIKNPDSVYVVPVLRNTYTKLRIANNTSSGLVVYKIATKTYQESVNLNLRSTSPSEGGVVFSNLKKTITLNFNKDIQKLSGTILLNGVSIQLSTCTVTNNVVTIPVTLTTQTGSNKNYTLTVSAGTFAELGNASNLTQAVTINFQALKSVLYPTNYTGLIDIVYKNVNSVNCRMDVYYPTNATTPVPVVINMHGGGWVSGAKEEQGGFDMYFNKGYAIVNVEYRMRNEILAPAAVEDVRGAMHYVLTHAQEWNIDKNKIVFQGGSAGGHLALMGGYLQNDRIYDNECVQYTGTIKVMAVIDKYGAADLITFTPVYSGMQSWLGSRSTDETFMKSLSPFHLVNAQTPPTYIIHGDADPTINYSQSVELNNALQAAGVKHKFTTVPGGGHGGFSDAYNTQFETEVIQFLTEVIALQPTAVKSINTDNKVNIGISGNVVKISSDGIMDIRIYDSIGNVVLSTQNNSFVISHKGLYIAKVKTVNGEYVSKLIIR